MKLKMPIDEKIFLHFEFPPPEPPLPIPMNSPIEYRIFCYKTNKQKKKSLFTAI